VAREEGGRGASRTRPGRAGPTRWLERHAIGLLGAATVVVLAVVFYYPVLTVFADAVRVGGEWTAEVVRGVLTDPFYFGLLAPIFGGEFGAVSEVAAESPLGLFGFTAYQALLSTVASVALGLPGAYVLSRYEFPGRRTLRSLTILPFVLPSIMVAIGFVAFFGTNGPLNDLLALVGLGPVNLLFTLEAIVVAHAFYNAPLVARVTTAAWESVDARMVETARSLGATPWYAFRTVLAPQLLPAVLTGALLTFVFTFMSFPIVLALGGFQLATVEVWVYSLVQELEYAEAATLAVAETVVSLALTYAYLRYEARQSGGGRAANPPPRKRLVPDSPSPLDALERLGVFAYAAVVAVVFVGPIASMVAESVTGPSGFTLQYYEFLVQRQVEGASFQTKPSVVESARALGATRVRALLDVELPLVASGVAAGAAFAFAISIGEFDSTVILATGSSSYTMPVAVERYIGNRTLGPATAMGTVLLFVTSLSFVVVDRLGGRWDV